MLNDKQDMIDEAGHVRETSSVSVISETDRANG